MDNDLLFTPTQRAPELTSGPCLNTESPLTLAGLRGQVVLVDIWDYSCNNCLRTLPYVGEWHRRYSDRGLTIVGVHTPQFAFGREAAQVAEAVRELEIHYPVVLDNNYVIWTAYANQFWPAKYLIDQHGYIRYKHDGEGNYGELEQAIQALLREADANIDLPSVMSPLRPEDYPEVLCHRPTPELRGGLYRGALGNPEGYAGGVPLVYRLPSGRRSGAFYVAGVWKADEQYLMYQGSSEGIIQVPYEASEVNAVLSPHADTVERMIHPKTITVEIWQDDLPILEERRGIDLTEDGRVLVHRPRLYNLIRNPDFERHELTLRVKSQGFALYGFTFVSKICS